MEKLLARMQRIATSRCFRDGVRAVATDNGIILRESVLPYHEVLNRLRSKKWIETIGREMFAIVIVVVITRSFFGENDSEFMPIIQACYEKLAGLDMLTCAEMNLYHVLMFKLSKMEKPAVV